MHLQPAFGATVKRIGGRFKFLHSLILSLLLYSLAMDAVIDTIDIWNGDWGGVEGEVFRPRIPRHNVREQSGLFTGSYFEAQTKTDAREDSLPLLGFQLVQSKSTLEMPDISGAFFRNTLLQHTFLSLPPPFFSPFC